MSSTNSLCCHFAAGWYVSPVWLQLPRWILGRDAMLSKQLCHHTLLDLVCRCDAKARAGCGSLRGVPLLQTRHPEGFDRAHFHDCAKKGEREWNDRILLCSLIINHFCNFPYLMSQRAFKFLSDFNQPLRHTVFWHVMSRNTQWVS